MKYQKKSQNPSPLIADLLRLTGYVVSKAVWFLRYHGLENIPENSSGAFLVVSNHQTYIDPVWVCLPMRRKIRYMAIEKAFDWKFVGRLIRYMGAFPVSPDAAGTVGAMKESLRAVKDGAVLTIFPEGEREFADGRMLKFKTGAVKIAMHTGVPILPVTISGGNRIWPQKQKYPRLFRRVNITYHPVIKIVEDKSVTTETNLELWTERLKAIIGGTDRPSY